MGGSYLTDMRRLRGRGETRAEIEEYFLSLDAELAARAEQVSCDWSQSEYSPLIGRGGAGGAAGGAAAGQRQDRAAQAGAQAGLGARDELLRQVMSVRCHRNFEEHNIIVVGSVYCVLSEIFLTPQVGMSSFLHCTSLLLCGSSEVGLVFQLTSVADNSEAWKCGLR